MRKRSGSKLPWVIALTVVLLALLGVGYWVYDAFLWRSAPAGADIWTAAQHGDGRRIKTLVRAKPSLVKACDAYGATALHVAVSRGDRRLVRLLISLGADLNQDSTDRGLSVAAMKAKKTPSTSKPPRREDSGRPLDIAYAHHRIDIALLLIKHGADPTASLPDAICYGQQDKLRFLVEHGADVTHPINVAIPNIVSGTIPGIAVGYQKGDQPIHLAVQTGKTEMVEYLLQHGSTVNAVGANGETPLHIVARDGSLPMVQFLLQHGAIRAVRNKAGKTPRDIAQEIYEMEVWKAEHGKTVVRIEKAAGCYTPPSDLQNIINLLTN